MSTLYFASTSANADPTTSGTFKDASTGSNTTITAGDTVIFDYRGTGKLAPTSTANLATDKYLAEIIIDKSFTGEIGDGTNYWRVHAAKVTAGFLSGVPVPNGGGSPRVMIQTNKSTAQTSAITRSGATATFTSATHGLANGATVVVTGADQTDYNITAVISNVTANTFDYTVANAPTTPSTGTASFYVPTTVTVVDAGSTSSDTQFPPMQFKSTGVTHNQSGGSVGYAVRTGETSTGTFNIAKGEGVNPAKLYLGPGVTPAAITNNGGGVTSRSDNTATAVTVTGANATYESLGSGAHTTLTVGAQAKAIYSGSGNIATLNNQGTFDRTRDTRAITVSTMNLYAGSSTLVNNGKASSTTRTTINLVQCGAQDIEVSTPLGERF
jgi:hypothetical protein